MIWRKKYGMNKRDSFYIHIVEITSEFINNLVFVNGITCMEIKENYLQYLGTPPSRLN